MSFRIENGGATEEQLRQIVASVLALPISRNKVPTLQFTCEGTGTTWLQRTSRETHHPGESPHDNSDEFTQEIRTLLTEAGEVTIGLSYRKGR